MATKLSIQWNKKPPTEVAGKLEYYDIDINQKYGLLEQDYATVKSHFSYQVSVGVSNPRIETVSRVRTVHGTPKEVYDYHYEHSNASRDMFVRGWKVAQNKNLDSLTVFPFKPAYTNEKLSEEINKSFYGGAREFAEKSKKDYSNIHKELKGKRKISLQQAIEYSKFLNCDPAKLLFEDLTTKIWADVDFIHARANANEVVYPSGQLKFLAEDKFTKVPRDIWRPLIRCVTVRSKGSYLNRHNLFYYKSKDKNPPNCHGKLCLIGVNQIEDSIMPDYTAYFVGIYEEGLGGKINLANPDPFAKDKYILIDIKNLSLVAPIVAVINPTLADDRDVKDQIEDFKRIKEDEQREMQMLLKKQRELQKENEVALKKLQEQLFEQIEKAKALEKKRA
jgi:hypothetical protein